MSHRRTTPPPDALQERRRDRRDEDMCRVDVVHLDAVRTACAALPAAHELERVVGIIALLSNPTRLRMLLALQTARGASRAELCVCDLSVVAGASKSMTSHQLRLLRAAGLVRTRRSGRLVYYRLAEGTLLPLLAALATLATRLAHAEHEWRTSTA